MKKKSIILILGFVFFILIFSQLSLIASSQATLISKGSLWFYDDTGTDLGTSWRTGTFSTISGNAELGYGDGDEITVIDYGDDSSNKYPTYYFRTNFNISNLSEISSLGLNILRDDGAVIYINGIEVGRSNMPEGGITYSTWATSSATEGIFYSYNLPKDSLVEGTNIIAVEVHQAYATSSDISFDLELMQNPPQEIIKGPYLQNVKLNTITIMWETSIPLPSRVDYGISNYDHYVEDPTLAEIHEITITELSENTIYNYQVSSNGISSEESTFKTATTSPIFSFLAYGDTRSNPDLHQAVINSMISNNPETFFLHTGDFVGDGNVYDKWQTEYFDPAQNLLKNTVLFSSPGNHEGNLNWYYSFFSMPTTSSSTEAYYSFDYGNSHFISLNDYVSFLPGSSQYNWLIDDLISSSAQNAEWIIVFYHVPAYTSGPHEGEPISLDKQTYLVPLFEQYGVDLIFQGHDHFYERSEKNNIQYITTGGGGAPLYEPNVKSNPYQVYAEKAHHHMRVDISDNVLQCKAYKNDLSVLDEFTLQSGIETCGDAYCDGSAGENCNTCPADCIAGTISGGGTCGACFKGVCNGECHPVKETSTCSDCSPTINYCCGDEICEGNENIINCAYDCDVPECIVDADCEDNNPCTIDACNLGRCENIQDPSCSCDSCFKGICDGKCHPEKDGQECPDCNEARLLTLSIIQFTNPISDINQHIKFYNYLINFF